MSPLKLILNYLQTVVCIFSLSLITRKMLLQTRQAKCIAFEAFVDSFTKREKKKQNLFWFHHLFREGYRLLTFCDTASVTPFAFSIS